MKLAALVLTGLLAACAPVTLAVPTARALPEAAPGSGPLPFAGPAGPPLRSNAEMARDILDLAFALEGGRPVAALSRFEGPVRLRVRGPAPPGLGRELSLLLARLRSEARLPIRQVAADRPAEITVQAVPAAEIARAAPQAACFVVPEAEDWDDFLRLRGTGALDWARVVRRHRAAVFVPSDAAPQEIRDCLHEEVAQALGPLNDLWHLPDSVFNDDNVHGTLTGFDMLVLRALNDGALRAGMSRAEVAARLPGILARLNPAGEQGDAGPVTRLPVEWARAMEEAHAEAAGPVRRRRAAEAAVGMARAAGPAPRLEGSALLALGRLQASAEPQEARATFAAAHRAFDRSPAAALHRAHAAMQLMAFALAEGEPGPVLDLAAEALPVAEAHGNAALAATILLLRAEALESLGRPAAARAARLDGLARARYGFGRPEAVDARLREVRSLRPVALR
ncbi:DUF2927 domain-containing protein [Rubellimicrobium sp. CFH 75288]|uniref:DUF2927 domain-containing protein n=1 Tax=Rubellimicrobium sp. CFH 75288 TaxID=2697034 RepID=UPI0014134CD2|nr:DUF2927 domain-containing protein [Rubellimicrobium sp. CFH 75288]NAZ35404.1 DUF2927 domain-containing protein [Rubellimicrobium sp. CFH 75288]